MELNSVDTLHNIAGGALTASAALISAPQINAIVALLVASVVSTLTQIIITYAKNQIAKLNGNNQNAKIEPENGQKV